jgi:hypothetical protein
VGHGGATRKALRLIVLVLTEVRRHVVTILVAAAAVSWFLAPASSRRPIARVLVVALFLFAITAGLLRIPARNIAPRAIATATRTATPRPRSVEFVLVLLVASQTVVVVVVVAAVTAGTNIVTRTGLRIIWGECPVGPVGGVLGHVGFYGLWGDIWLGRLWFFFDVGDLLGLKDSMSR